MMVPEQAIALGKVLERLDPLLATSVREAPVEEWEELAHETAGLIARLRAATHPLTGNHILVEAPERRVREAGEAVLPRPGAWLVVGWAAPCAFRHSVGDTLKVVRASRCRDGRVLAVTDKGLVSSSSYDWEVLPVSTEQRNY